MAENSICTCVVYMYIAIRVHQTAGEFGVGGEKSRDTALQIVFCLLL